MAHKKILGAAAIILIIAVVIGLLLNGIPVIKNMPVWIKTLYMNIWLPAIIGIGGIALALYANKKSKESIKVTQAPPSSSGTLTPPMTKPDDVPIKTPDDQSTLKARNVID